jgi:DNA-binding CsgD family transcriptional regulator
VTAALPSASHLPLAAALLHHYREPLFLIDADATVLFLNGAGELAVRTHSGFLLSGNRLRCTSVKCDRRLRTLLSRAASVPGVRLGLRVERARARDWLVLLHAVQLPPAPTGALPLFCIQAIGRAQVRRPPVDALAELFALTQREADVVGVLLKGASASEIATSLSLSRETVRSHLKRIFRKCEVSSMLELLALVQAASDFGP